MAEYVKEYKESLTSRTVPMCIPRFFNNKAKNFNAKSIDQTLDNFMTKEFTKIKSGKAPSNLFMTFDRLILDSLIRD